MPEARQRSAAARLAIAIAASIAVAGCGEQDGESTHFPGTVAYDSPDGAYHFHYLSPPWIPVKLLGMATPVFVVPPPEITSVTSEADAPFSLRIEPVAAPAEQAIQERARTLSPPLPADRIRDVMSLTGGRAGQELSWQEGSVFRREAYLAGAQAGSSFRLRFTAQRDIAADPMITQMIVSFEPHSSGVEVHSP